MEKKDKILIIILMILLIAIIVGVCLYCKEEPTSTISEENVKNITSQENIIEEEFTNNIGENKIEEEKIVEENKIEENTVKEETTSNIVGKEEQESKEENTGKTNEEKAIQVAKKEWGTEDGVSFDIQNREGNIYTVAVRSTSNTQVYAWYRVNVETEKVEE